ncbi:unnamed protein product [Heterobilharzia americana]|nr:unnamed protein product [Heterobilharzia americana]
MEPKKKEKNQPNELFMNMCKPVQANRLARVTEVSESDFDISEQEEISSDDDNDDDDNDDDDDDLDDTDESDAFSDDSMLSNTSYDNTNKRYQSGDVGKKLNKDVSCQMNTSQLGNTQFLRLERMRAELEEELGFELLIKAYNVIQALQEDEDETITESEQIISSVLGEEKAKFIMIVYFN